jgi:hypothetical protein
MILELIQEHGKAMANLKECHISSSSSKEALPTATNNIRMADIKMGTTTMGLNSSIINRVPGKISNIKNLTNKTSNTMAITRTNLLKILIPIALISTMKDIATMRNPLLNK